MMKVYTFRVCYTGKPGVYSEVHATGYSVSQSGYLSFLWDGQLFVTLAPGWSMVLRMQESPEQTASFRTGVA